MTLCFILVLLLFQNCLGIIYTTYLEKLPVELETLVGNIIGCVQAPPPGKFLLLQPSFIPSIYEVGSHSLEYSGFLIFQLNGDKENLTVLLNLLNKLRRRDKM